MNLGARGHRKIACVCVLMLAAIAGSLATETIGATGAASKEAGLTNAVKAAAFSKLLVSPRKHSFSKIDLGRGTTNATFIIVISNPGTQALHVTVSGPVAPFSIAADAGSSTIDPKSEEQITVLFQPVAAGKYATHIAVTSDATRGKSGTNVSLTGKAIGSPGPTPAPSGYFSTAPPKAPVPGLGGEATCANEIPVTAETISSNAQPWSCAGQSCPAANSTLPDGTTLSEVANDTFFETEAGSSGEEDAIPYMQEVTGSYASVSPSTDMIIRWASCKWGLDEDSMRAEAVVESSWHQIDDFGDASSIECTAGEGVSLIGLEGASPSSSECWRSFGLFQIMVVSPNYNTWDGAWKATAFNADYRAAFQRACMDGKIASYIRGQGVSQYAAYTNPANAANASYMFWGCMGEWFSGSWYDSGAKAYISHVQQALSSKAWIGIQ